MRPHGLGQCVKDSHARIERGIRVLENHLEVRPRCTQLFLLQLRQIFASQNHRARRGWNQLQNCPAQRGFAAAGFAHQAEDFSTRQRERHAIHGLHCAQVTTNDHPALHREVRFQILNMEKAIRHV